MFQVFALFNSSGIQNDLVGVSVTGMTAHVNGTSVTFLVDLKSGSVVTEVQFTQAFIDGLTGGDNNTVPSNSLILTGSMPTVQLPGG